MSALASVVYCAVCSTGSLPHALQPASVGRKGVDPFFAYDANYLIDNKAGVIVDTQGARQSL